MTAFKYIILLFIFNFNSAEDDCDIGINVGTVLFTQSDDSKKCWTNEQLALLRARFVFQDLLPDIKVITMENDKFVTTLLNYFRLAMQKVKSVTSGKTRQLHMRAMLDVIGGYLQHAVIPISNHAFYMGNICFESAEKIKEFYEEIKAYLRTNGKTWASPITSEQIPKTTTKRKRATPVSENESTGNNCENLVFSDLGNGSMSVPMPFLDSKTNPITIAVPLKTYPLHNIKSPNSVNILSKFYDMAIACMKEKTATKESIDKFNQDFAAFIESDILPLTKQGELMPAFGGVFPLEDTIKHGGHPSAPISGNGTTEAAGNATTPYDENEYYEDDKSTAVMFTAVGVVILIWIITGLIYCCCRMRRKQKPGAKGDAKSRRSRSRSRCSGKSDKSPKDDPCKKKLQSMKGDPCPKVPRPKQSRDSVKSSPKTPPSSPPDKKSSLKKPPPKSPPPKKPDKKPSDAKKQEQGKSINKKSVDIRQCSKCNKITCKKHRSHESSDADQKTPPTTPPRRAHRTQQTVGYVIGGPNDPKIKGVKSAPVRMKKGMSYLPDHTCSSTSTEKPVVFGYDFETTTSDSSSFDDTSSYTASACSTPKKV